LVVATYSMYSPAVLRTAQQNPDYHPSVFKGCFMDEAKKRDLPVLRDLQMVYSKDHRNFATQLCSCECSGFKYAALQNGGECFCGNSFGSYGSGGDSCHLSCDATRSRSDGKMSWCGGALSNAVYELQSSPNSSAVLQQREKIVVGEVGDSCTESCRKANGASEHFVFIASNTAQNKQEWKECAAHGTFLQQSTERRQNASPQCCPWYDGRRHRCMLHHDWKALNVHQQKIWFSTRVCMRSTVVKWGRERENSERILY